MIRAAYEGKFLSYQDIMNYIEVLRVTGRHISDKLFRQLLEELRH